MAATNCTVTIDRLKEVLSYDPDTGSFTWLMSLSNNAPKGSIAKNIRHGYMRVRIDNVLYMQHRLAWLYMTGSWPPAGMHIDHINGDRADNRWSNLRLATPRQNQQNRRNPEFSNKTGYMGVTLVGGRYRANITNDGKSIAIGSFDTLEEAHAAYLKKKREIHEYCTI